MRNIPYATDGAHTADTLLAVGRGDCLAKSAYLLREFTRLGHQARRVRWLYHLGDQPAEVQLLPSREDVHTACEIRLDGAWVLVDPTHDPELAAAGLTVADWDGLTDTAPAYPPCGEVWRPGGGPEPVPNGGAAPSICAARAYQRAFNQWLEQVRIGA
ncbi:hypothetical protein OG875_05065 [Streptomyces sp. NBC_01498]|uniref:hypothetical protein n=1 Tax=Streptomyces sp. NBC_01498 TaxID=2975870 RepID=UPI002E7B9826|nr:hypothetical protein [Streptomyces sp. NBC_01498]WTL24028.1 hypothetical protein OG875_05065 [Streptomyces sp. NBC_01498]